MIQSNQSILRSFIYKYLINEILIKINLKFLEKIKILSMSRLSSTNVLIKSQNLYPDEISVSHNNPNKDTLPKVKSNKKLTFSK
jgi:hypothetical protein